jgi:hypothetical protein
MTIPGAFSEAGIAELIEDCSALPAALCDRTVPAADRPAPAWVVSDANQAHGDLYDAHL